MDQIRKKIDITSFDMIFGTSMASLPNQLTFFMYLCLKYCIKITDHFDY